MLLLGLLLLFVIACVFVLTNVLIVQYAPIVVALSWEKLKFWRIRADFNINKIQIYFPDFGRLIFATILFFLTTYSYCKFRSVTNIEAISLWWLITSLFGVLSVCTIADKALAKFISLFGFAPKLIMSLLLASLVWFLSNEARSAANVMLGVPSRELPSTAAVLTFILASSLAAIASIVIALIAEIIAFLTMILVTNKKKLLVLRASWTLILMIFVCIPGSGHLLIPLNEKVYTQLSALIAMKYDFDDKVACLNSPKDTKFMFIDGDKQLLVYFKLMPDSDQTIAERLSAKEPKQFFSEMGVMKCDWLPGKRDIPSIKF